MRIVEDKWQLLGNGGANEFRRCGAHLLHELGHWSRDRHGVLPRRIKEQKSKLDKVVDEHGVGDKYGEEQRKLEELMQF